MIVISEVVADGDATVQFDVPADEAWVFTRLSFSSEVAAGDNGIDLFMDDAAGTEVGERLLRADDAAMSDTWYNERDRLVAHVEPGGALRIQEAMGVGHQGQIQLIGVRVPNDDSDVRAIIENVTDGDADVEYSGESATALEFPGNGTAGNASTVQPALDVDQVTVEAWVFLDNVTDNVNRAIDKNIDRYSLFTWDNSPNSITDELTWRLKDDAGGQHDIFLGSSLQTTEWVHIAGTYDSDGTMKMYVNGEEQASAVNGTGTLEKGGRVVVGARGDQSTNQVWAGEIDEVRIWDHVRTQQEIQDNMFRELEGNEDGLAAYWKMDEGSGTTVEDSSGNGWDLTLNGSVNWQTGFALFAHSFRGGFTTNGSVANGDGPFMDLETFDGLDISPRIQLDAADLVRGYLDFDDLMSAIPPGAILKIGETTLFQADDWVSLCLYGIKREAEV